MTQVDLFILGGGINGMGIAADAQGRGLSVVLCDKGDFGGMTSQSSSKLIHGGLRYLEFGQFKLVRQALAERTILLNTAKHLVKPLLLRLPCHKKMRASWKIRLGLFLYDNLFWNNTLPSTRSSVFAQQQPINPLKEEYPTGFEFYDATGDDARLVIANALRAKQKGALLHNYTVCRGATRLPNHWDITLQDLHTGKSFSIKAKIAINATGPCVSEVDNQVFKIIPQHSVRLVKGSHIVLPRVTKEEAGYVLQHTDGRIVFMLPFAEHYTMVGTTDVPFAGDPATCTIDNQETQYLLSLVNEYLKNPFEKKDIVHTWAGVRPLFNDKAKHVSRNTREHYLCIDAPSQSAPLLSIIGGKLTGYRHLAEEVLEKLHPWLPSLGSPWTHSQPLPGADFEGSLREAEHNIAAQYPWLPGVILHRYLRQYGSHIHLLLANAHRVEDLGEDFGFTLFQREVDYLMAQEWAKTADDILWRRTKLGIRFSAQERLSLAAYMKTNELLP